MPLTPIERSSVPDAVFDQLVAGIVDGELAPGAPLPSERALAEALGVSRPAVREALKRLSHAGLVDIRQGESTTVNDFRTHASLDILPRLLVDADGNVDVRVARSVIEVRAAIGPELAALAAARATDESADAVTEAVGALAATDPDDDIARQRRALDVWDRLVDASDNVVYRLLFNALRKAYEPVMDALAAVMRAEVSDLHAFETLAVAVADGDPDAARDAASQILGHGTRTTLEAIDLLLEEDPA
ncbi:MAG: GntR family transcriptional regulator [Nitriliruptorales bacterium]|nr:GntR family transcriptional regulator [Nitriliruptorales bacterium]